MIHELSNRLLKQLETELEEIIYQDLSPIKKLSSQLKIIRQSLKKLKNFIDDHPFTSDLDEIMFFKDIKPEFYKWQIYFNEIYIIQENIPLTNIETQRQYFENELIFVQRFFRENSFLYEYYKRNANELDNLYFVRGKENISSLMPNLPELDSSFSTSCDYLFSKIKAFEMLKEWLIERINLITKNPFSNFHSGGGSEEMRWTGESINLAELAFGIHRTKQLNNGTASIGAIFRWLEDKLQLNIGIPSKRLSEIRRRTSISRTRFLDEMAESILQKLDKEDEYSPDKSNKKNNF